jgi:hypothetical protein
VVNVIIMAMIEHILATQKMQEKENKTCNDEKW